MRNSHIDKALHWVFDIGIKRVKDSSEHELLRFYNKMLAVIIVLCSSLFFISLFFPVSPIYFLIVAACIAIYGMALFLNHLGQIYIVRYFICLFTASWITLSHVLLGGFFSQSVGILTAMIIAMVSFQKRLGMRKWIVGGIGAMYIGGMLTSMFLGGPVFYEPDFPIDELMVFVASTYWTMGLFFIFENQKESLIKDLKNKNVELKNTATDLERFTYIASHDLKSPALTISTFLKLIRTDLEKENYEAIHQKLDFAEGSANQMIFLIEGILELSQVRDSKKLERKMVDLNQVLKHSKVSLHNLIKEKNAIIQAQELPQFYCNEVEMAMLFQNFIQNGIKYNTSDRPTINIKAQHTPNFLRISFRDNGIGINKKHHAEIFEFFTRLHAHAEYQGTGLGLGVCKKIVESYEGNIEVDSVPANGSIFTIVFPLHTKKSSSPSLLKQLTLDQASPMEAQNVFS